MKRFVYIGLALTLIVGAMVPASVQLTARADLDRFDLDALSPAQRGAVLFTAYDWGGLNGATLRTNAVPWKLAETVLALRAVDGDLSRIATPTQADLFEPFGFHVPTGIANWPEGVPEPVLGDPLGIVRAQSGGVTPLRVEIANTGCAACHASVVYREDGTPDVGNVWLGGTNSSLNLDAYTSALFDGFLTYGDDLIAATALRFPDMTTRERATLHYALLPPLMDELRRRDAVRGQLLPFAPSHVGATNGFDSLRLRLDLIEDSAPVDVSQFTSIPALGGRTWRSRFLANGVYVPEGGDAVRDMNAADIDDAHLSDLAQIVSYFLLPSMGVTADVAASQHDPARDVMAWIDAFEHQPYPAAIDLTRAAMGREIYMQSCAACHGTYDGSLDNPSLQSFPNWEGDIGTAQGPPTEVLTPLATAIDASSYGAFMDTRVSELRSAPPLSGLWASAPYLANGSVPTLWHLMRPDARPAQFMLGGHALDMNRVGIALTPPADYAPWSDPQLFDTTQPGFSNAGHSVGFTDLSEAEKDALLEYLKLL